MLNSLKAPSALIATSCAIICLCSTAQATIFQYSTTLSGAAESPPVASPGTGFASLDYDDFAHTLTLNVSFSGLIGNTTASHIHAATAVPFAGNAGVATTTPTFVAFPLGVTAGTYSRVLDLTSTGSYNAAYITANGGSTATAEVALMAAIASGRAYLNIHSSFAAGGEIRGYFQPVPTPGAASALLGAGALVSLRRRRS